MKTNKLMVLMLSVVFMAGCAEDKKSGSVPSQPVQPLSKPDVNKQKFVNLIEELEAEANEKARVHFSSYQSIESRIRTVQIKLDQTGEKAQVRLVSKQGMVCTYSPASVDALNEWAGVSRSLQMNCDREHRNSKTNVVRFADGYIVRIKDIVAADIHFIGIIRTRQVSVNASTSPVENLENELFASHFLGRDLRVQAVRLIYPDGIEAVQLNHIVFTGENENWTNRFHAMDEANQKMLLYSQSLNIGLGTFFEEGPDEGMEKMVFAKNAEIKSVSKNFVVDLHGIIESGMKLLSSKESVNTEIVFEYLEEK